MQLEKWNFLLGEIHYYFHDSELFILYQVCRSWNGLLRKIDQRIYKRRCAQYKMKVERLPKTFISWRDYFYTKRRMYCGNADFYICTTILKIPAGGWNEVRKRMAENYRFEYKGYSNSCNRISFQNRRYLGFISTSKLVYSEGQHVWFASDMVIKCINLLTNRITYTLDTHSFQINSISGNGSGTMVSIDVEKFHHFWRLENGRAYLMYKKAFLNGSVNVRLFPHEILCMDGTGTVLIWDIHTGNMLAQLELQEPAYLHQYTFHKSDDYLYCLNRENGEVSLYQPMPSKHFSLLPLEYHKCGIIASAEYSLTHYPDLIQACNDCFVSCSHGELFIWTLPVRNYISSSQSLNFNYFHGNHTMVDTDFSLPVRPTDHPVVLSELETLKRFGFQAASSYPDYRQFAVDVDESSFLLYCADSYGSPSLSIWDFRVNRKYDRYYERIKVGNHDCFICYEDIGTDKTM
jgi:hypothetical protein